MARMRKKFGRDVIRILHARSHDRCECCGLDIIIDKHHIWEFAQGGPDTADNILCLCQSCHNILPKLLNEDDQKYIQTLNFDKRCDTFSFFSSEAVFEIGGVLYKNVDRLLILNGKPIIYTYKVNGRFYANIIMLSNFEPYLLIIGNRAVYKSNGFTVISTQDSLEVRHNDKRVFKMEQTSGKIKVYLNFTFKGHVFDLNERESIIPGGGHLRGVIIENSPGGFSMNIH